MSKSSRAFVALALLVAVPAVAGAQAASVPKQVVTRPGARPSANLSGGIRVGDMLYASGTLGSPDSTIEAQTRMSLEAQKAVFEAGGTSMENVVKCTVFLTRATDFQAMNGVYRTFFPKDPPARSTVVVAALVSQGALVEIECVAAVPKS